jgi:hypothetical protein
VSEADGFHVWRCLQYIAKNYVRTLYAIAVPNEKMVQWDLVAQASQLAEKLEALSFRGALRAEESLFLWHSISERFLASVGMTK